MKSQLACSRGGDICASDRNATVCGAIPDLASRSLNAHASRERCNPTSSKKFDHESEAPPTCVPNLKMGVERCWIRLRGRVVNIMSTSPTNWGFLCRARESGLDTKVGGSMRLKTMFVTGALILAACERATADAAVKEWTVRLRADDIVVGQQLEKLKSRHHWVWRFNTEIVDGFDIAVRKSAIPILATKCRMD